MIKHLAVLIAFLMMIGSQVRIQGKDLVLRISLLLGTSVSQWIIDLIANLLYLDRKKIAGAICGLKLGWLGAITQWYEIWD